MDALSTASYPRFAVVGHPNKGKSTVVSSLAWDDSVHISDTPGTTTRTRSFPFRVDGHVLYTLLDTPGFQRPRKVLAWLQKHNVRADRRPEAVRAFLHTFKNDSMFADEIALLTPIMEGAGILYVVDGAKPYGEEYEAEMEILRWTGQPSMALINTIGPPAYRVQWQRALAQYFKLIRRFDPMAGRFEEHRMLLEAIAQLDETWTAPVQRAIALLEAGREARIVQSAEVIAELVRRSVMHVERRPHRTADIHDQARADLHKRYRNTLRTMEANAQQEIEKIWRHTRLQKEAPELPFDGMDLFSKESVSIFGLSRQEIIIAGAAGGAATGAGVDLLLAGHTLLLGGLVGGLIGGAGAWWGFDELAEVRLLGTTLGNRMLEMGPMSNRNFPWVLLGRALYHLHVIAGHSHARREAIALDMDAAFKEQWLDPALRRRLETHHMRFRRHETISAEALHGYAAHLLQAIRKII